MSPSSFPEDVQHFLLRYIDSLEELEILLCLQRESAGEFAADAVATLLYTNPQSTASKLRALNLKGLVDVQSQGGVPRYQFRRSSPKARLVERLAELYAERRVAVINIILSKPLPNIQAFADAFDLRKQRED